MENIIWIILAYMTIVHLYVEKVIRQVDAQMEKHRKNL
jgi:hypothetical protein